MNKEEIRLIYTSLHLAHPPLPRFRRNQLPDLFAKICNTHEFESFTMQADQEAEFSTEGVRLLHLERDRLHIDEHVQVAFELVRREFSDLVDIVKGDLTIPVFFEPSTELRLLWPLPSGTEKDSAAILKERVVGLHDDQYDLLGAQEIRKVSLTISADMTDDVHRSVEIGPYARDQMQVYIQLNTHRHAIVETPSVLSEFLAQDYEYLCNRVTAFVQTFLP